MTLDDTDVRARITAELSGMIAEARQTGKWLFCQYQQLWFSPDELTAANAEGRFLWGAANWILRDPTERLQQLENAIGDIRREAEQVRGRMR